MSGRERKALKALRVSIRDNSPRVEKKLARSGLKPDLAVVYSAAKYYETLKKLAKE